MTSPYSWSCGGLVAALLALVLLPIVVPGGALWSRLERRAGTPRHLSLLLALATSALLGYATFWVYVLDAAAGRLVSWLLVAASACLLVLPAERRRLGRWLAHRDVAIPLALLVGSAYFALTYFLAFVPDPMPDGWTWMRHAHARIGIPDNVLPLFVAGKLAAGESLNAGAFVAQSTARPPLQAGIVLLQHPAWALVGSFWPPAIVCCYQTLGVLLQSIWVVAAWGLARALGGSRGRATLLVVTLVPSTMLLQNTVYVWPKLLAASFTLGAYCLLLLRPPDAARPTVRAAGAAAALACLGLLAHPAVVTSLLGFGLLLCVPRWFPGWRSVGTAAIVAVVLVGPWAAYQTWFRPVHYSLAKQFLTGSPPADQRSLGELLRSAYVERPLGQLLREKATAAATVLGLTPPAGLGTWQQLRTAQMRGVLPSLDVLNVGWVLAVVGWFRRRPSDDVRRRQTLLVGLLCLALSVLLIFESHALHHTSYATLLLLFVTLAAEVATLPAGIGAALLAAHAGAGLVVFSTLLETHPFRPALPTLAFALAAWTGLAGAAVAAHRTGWLDDDPRTRVPSPSSSV